MIARLYVQDSLTYPKQAEYWLNYAQNLAAQLLERAEESREGGYAENEEEEFDEHGKLLTNLKRCQALRCAFMIDQGLTEEALSLLEHFKEEKFSDENEEKDIEMVVHSLYGILATNTEEG